MITASPSRPVAEFRGRTTDRTAQPGTRNRTGHDPGSRIPDAVRPLLAEIGEDAGRAGLIDTPDRVRRMFAEMTSGYASDPNELLAASYEVGYDQMGVVRDIGG